MKKILFFAFCTQIIATSAWADSQVFTSISATPSSVFAGVKIEKRGMEPDTYILEVSSSKLTSQKVALPKDLIHREVVAILPTKDNQIIVITQKKTEQGDSPQIHTYQPGKKTWNKLAEVECSTFKTIKLEPKSVTLSCLVTNKAGDEFELMRETPLKEVELIRTGLMELPFNKIEEKNLKAELLGEIFEWNQLKVVSNKKEKVFSP
jgi:hypothetical protein